MRREMRYMVLLAIVGLCAAAVLAGPGATPVEREKDATQVARAWFHSLMRGETAVTTSLSAVPFDFDRKEEVKTLPDLKARYDGIVGDKGKRDLKETSARIESSSPEKVVVVLMIEDEGVAVTVKPGEAFRVVGFSD
jgi:hypothetical protein